MARVPDFKRLAKEDFPEEYRNLIDKLAFPINSHFEQVRSALNKNINFQNLDQEIKTLSFTTGSSGQPASKQVFKSSISGRVQGIIIIRAVITSSNTSFVQTAPVISWNQNEDLVTITNIGGLLPETGYQLTIMTL